MGDLDSPRPDSTSDVSSLGPQHSEVGARRSEVVKGDRANELVLAYRAGRAELLTQIWEELRPILLTAIGRYGSGGRSLPSSLESGDLLQQSWLILDALARRWRPERGDFGAYVRTVFPWALWRYVRAELPGRGARGVRVDGVRHDELLDRCADRPGVDGRDWDEELGWAGMLDELEPLPRRVFVLHVIEDRSFAEIARALRLTDTGAYREYRRALDDLRSRAGLEVRPVGSDDRPPADAGQSRAIERLVQALHEGVDVDGRLPGRAWVCARTGISEGRLARLMGLLVSLGCVEGRAARRAGRLVYATAAETLERVLSAEC